AVEIDIAGQAILDALLFQVARQPSVRLTRAGLAHRLPSSDPRRSATEAAHGGRQLPPAPLSRRAPGALDRPRPQHAVEHVVGDVVHELLPHRVAARLRPGGPDAALLPLAGVV